MSSKALRQVLIGKETNPGEGVTVDVALRATASLKAVPDKVIVEEDIGSFAPARHYIGSLKAEGSLEMDGYYEHAPYPVSMAMGAGNKAGEASPYTWTFELPDDAADTFATYTVEYSDGADHIVHAEDVFATELEISGEAGQTWMFKPTLAGGQVTFPAAVGASLSAGTATSIRMADTTLSIDDTFAGIGTTPVAVLISFNWKLSNLQHQKLFAGSLWPSGRGNNKWETTLELIVEIEEATIEAEKAKLLTTAQSAIEIAALDEDAGGEGVDYSATISGMYMLQDVDTLDDRDGNNIVKLTYKGEKDSSDNTGSIVIATSLSAL